MAKTLELPVLGNSMEEGTITQWFKAEGENVAKGEALYEVMSFDDVIGRHRTSPRRIALSPIALGVNVNRTPPAFLFLRWPSRPRERLTRAANPARPHPE